MPLFPPTDVTAPAGATRSSVAASAVVVTLLAANNARLQASFYNDASTGSLYLALGSAATFTNYTVRLEPQEVYELPYRYTGIVTGLWSVADVGASVRVTELTTA